MPCIKAHFNAHVVLGENKVDAHVLTNNMPLIYLEVQILVTITFAKYFKKDR